MKKSLENTLYHSFLRVAVAVCALALVFDSGLLFSSTANISNLVQQNVATVIGVKASVAPNDMNVLTARITELETDLQAKERLIAVNLQEREVGGSLDTSTFVLSITVFILLVLMILNYTLDYLRARRPQINYERNTSQVA